MDSGMEKQLTYQRTLRMLGEKKKHDQNYELNSLLGQESSLSSRAVSETR